MIHSDSSSSYFATFTPYLINQTSEDEDPDRKNLLGKEVPSTPVPYIRLNYWALSEQYENIFEFVDVEVVCYTYSYSLVHYHDCWSSD